MIAFTNRLQLLGWPVVDENPRRGDRDKLVTHSMVHKGDLCCSLKNGIFF